MLRVLDLFSGIGGFSLGLERTGGFRTVAFCEIEPYCRAVLARHWPHVPCFEDVRLLDGEVLDIVGIERPDVICGGFPCQDISLAGKGAGLAGERSGLWFEYLRLIKDLRPTYAVIENVSALRSRGLAQVLGSLASIGYGATWDCIPACAVGAPHIRDRVWIVAYPDDDDDGREEWAQRYRESLRRQLEASQRDHTLRLRDAVPDAEQQQLREQSGRGSGPNGTGAPLTAEHGAQQSLADSDCGDEQRRSSTLQMGRGRGQGEASEDGFPGRTQWSSEPDVGRVAHGVPSRVDRLRCLGNAVVPQIPQIIGQTILEAEGRR